MFLENLEMIGIYMNNKNVYTNDPWKLARSIFRSQVFLAFQEYEAFASFAVPFSLTFQNLLLSQMCNDFQT